MTIPESSTVEGASSNPQCLYIFLDEGGNLDFSTNGTRYFTISTITKIRPFALDSDLLALKYDLLEEGLDLERFHASEDKQPSEIDVKLSMSENSSVMSCALPPSTGSSRAS